MAEDIQLMLQHIRVYDPEKDAHLPKYSHSKAEKFTSCNRAFMYKYKYENYPKSDSISTELGSIVHRVLEYKALMKMEGKPIDYDFLHNVLFEGDEEENLIGVNKIKLKYYDEWEEFDDKSGMYYDEKIELFLTKVLPNEMEDDWEVLGAEVNFDFVYNNKYHIAGFIDLLQCKRDEDGNITKIRVTDYKTSKKVFDRQHNVTAQQMLIYTFAVYLMYGMLPAEHVYDFILLNKKQSDDVLTNGYLKRGINKMNKLFASIEECEETGIYRPNPSPLCHWCEFCETNQNAKEPYNTMCKYFSCWLPTYKTFITNEDYCEEDDLEI